MEHIRAVMERRGNDGGQNSGPTVRTINDGDWYWIGRKILRLYGQRIGLSGLAVYNVLAFFAGGKTQACYPTHKTIGKLAGLGKRTVVKRIQILEKEGLIRRERQNGQAVYYLLE